ncbi:chromosome condensation protein CrcB [Brachybacterium sp. P6-10-X1]|uniref:fluoride efflux transporter CrcB n=1 Tax=Brachybacterium sp. P6-10-X1 TaxID=1903186 RepID=UPI000971822F|nr:fluoride efflux transporter CrcB [Brachybacterium sp. P6-10-X1]APX32916.1 chromosome condensation protein CrcB [Brachybacterium sp. P6-10-X1]
MTPLLFLLLSVAGGIGAATRFLLDGMIRDRTDGSAPWGTILINLSGSLLLGLLTGAVLAHAAPGPWQLVLGTGFLGGYTTFSSASIETVRLLQERRLGAGMLNGLGSLLGTCILAALGLWLGSML